MTGDWAGKRDNWLIDEKTLEINNNNEGKNQQIEIDKKPPNPVGIEEENQSVSRAGYYVFVFLFRVLVAASCPRFCLILRDWAVGGRTIMGRDH